MATDSLDPTPTGCNPVAALAEAWAAIIQEDCRSAGIPVDLYERKDQLEARVLRLEPKSIDDVLSMLVVAIDEFHPKDGQPDVVRALRAAAAWLALHGGAASP